MARIASITMLAGALTTGLIAVAQFADSPAHAPAAAAPSRIVARQTAVGSHTSRTAAPPAQRTAAGSLASFSGDTSRVIRGPGQTARSPQRATIVIGATACRPRYTIRPGETLSSIAARCYRSPADWPALYDANIAAIANPDLIYPGQVLTIPARPALLTAYAVQDGGSDTADGSPVTAPGWHRAPGSGGTTAKPTAGPDRWPGRGAKRSSPVSVAADGAYACGGLEALWEQAGGNPADARLAAGIALAESGGNPGAVSPTDDYGLWQINASNGALATLSPQANARSAVILSHGGTDWSPWTTYRTGAYWGRC